MNLYSNIKEYAITAFLALIIQIFIEGAKHCKKCFTYTAGNTARFIFHLTRYLVNTKESLKEAVRYDSKFSGSLNLQVSRNLPQLYVLFSYQCVPSL